MALSDLEVGFIYLKPQQWSKQNWCVGGCWVTQAGFLGFSVAIFFMLVQVYEAANNPVISEVDAHSIGGLSFTPGESPEGGGGAFPKCQFAPRGCLRQGTLISRRPGSLDLSYHNTSLDTASFFQNVFFFFC